MPAGTEEEDEDWFRPVWESDEEELDPPGRRPLPRGRLPENEYAHPLLSPLARAQDALARLEARAESASEAVADGLRARLSYREAAGWLAQVNLTVHPHDLALRDEGLTGSYGTAHHLGRLATALPATSAQGVLEEAPSDILVGQALRLARLWRRLAEMRTWRPLADAVAAAESLSALGCRGAVEADIADWMAAVELGREAPALLRAARAARDWMNRPGIDPRNPDGPFLAACLWREEGRQPIALPFWMAPEPRHHRLGLQVGSAWISGFLGCIETAARLGSQELMRLTAAEEKTRTLGRTSRSRLHDAAMAALRAPVLTARGLAARIHVTPQASLNLLRQLEEAGLVQEGTGRLSWRAFILKA